MDLFLNQIVALPVVVMDLDDADGLVLDDVDTDLVLPLPLPPERPETLLEEQGDVRTDDQTDELMPAVLGEERNLILDFLVQDDRRLDFAGPAASGANVGDALDGDGPHPLTRNLHQTELGEGQDGMLGLIISHELDHLLEEQLPVLRLMQVDEVDDDDTPEVAQTQLPCDLLGGGEVDIHGGLLLVVLGLGTVAGIDVDDVHGLGPLDDEVSPALERNVLGEERLDLLGNIEIVEDGHAAAVELDDLLLLGLDLPDVIANLVEHGLVVDGDLRKRTVQRIADDGIGPVHLAHDLSRRKNACTGSTG